jgi:steroid delta-isomerase-like uncharacterized protein
MKSGLGNKPSYPEKRLRMPRSHLPIEKDPSIHVSLTHLMSSHFNNAQARHRERESMLVTSVLETQEEVRTFIQEYFDAWKGTDVQKILAYYSDDVVIQLPTGTLEGKSAVRDNFVIPFVNGFPGNVHSIRNLADADNLVAVEWRFDAVHKGNFAGFESTGRTVQVLGCSFYEYNLESRKIHAGRIYFDLATLMRQIERA